MIDEKTCGLNPDIQNKLIFIFKKSPAIKRVILYGSRAMGTYKLGSDIDLTIKAANSLPLTEMLKIKNEIDDLLLPYKVDLSTYESIDNKDLVGHIDRVGLVFFSSESKV